MENERVSSRGMERLLWVGVVLVVGVGGWVAGRAQRTPERMTLSAVDAERDLFWQTRLEGVPKGTPFLKNAAEAAEFFCTPTGQRWAASEGISPALLRSVTRAVVKDEGNGVALLELRDGATVHVLRLTTTGSPALDALTGTQPK